MNKTYLLNVFKLCIQIPALFNDNNEQTYMKPKTFCACNIRSKTFCTFSVK